MFIKQKVTARKHKNFKVSPIFSQYQILLSEIWIIYFNENPNVLKVFFIGNFEDVDKRTHSPYERCSLSQPRWLRV